jgi:hypothetical protein
MTFMHDGARTCSNFLKSEKLWIRFGKPAFNLGNLLFAELQIAPVLLLHLRQDAHGFFLSLGRPREHAVQDGLDLLFLHDLTLSQRPDRDHARLKLWLSATPVMRCCRALAIS